MDLKSRLVKWNESRKEAERGISERKDRKRTFGNGTWGDPVGFLSKHLVRGKVSGWKGSNLPFANLLDGSLDDAEDFFSKVLVRSNGKD